METKQGEPTIVVSKNIAVEKRKQSKIEEEASKQQP